MKVHCARLMYRPWSQKFFSIVSVGKRQIIFRTIVFAIAVLAYVTLTKCRRRWNENELKCQVSQWEGEGGSLLGMIPPG
jgi:hypothetical protein